MEKEIVNQYDDLYTELCASAKKLTRVQHYTNLHAFESIISKGSLRLSRIDLVNDLNENERIHFWWKNKLFVACFTYRETESTGFWSIHREKGVMLSFPTISLIEPLIYSSDDCSQDSLLHITKRTDLKHHQYDSPSDWGVYDTTFAAIHYTKDLGEFIYEDEELKEFFKGCIMVGFQKDFKRTKFPGLIKSIAWDHEKEVRLRVGVRPKGPEQSSTCIYYPHFQYLYIKLTEDTLSNLVVTLNPWANEEFHNEVRNILQQNIHTKDYVIQKSNIDGTIR